jgi:hypothetical protein
VPVDLVAILKIASFVIIQITSSDLSRVWLRPLRQVGPEASRPEVRYVIGRSADRRDLRLDLRLVRGLSVHDALGSCMGFAFEASGVPGSGLGGRILGSETPGCLAGLTK